jgi:diguanylate cyclase (GGDEF)-like protein
MVALLASVFDCMRHAHDGRLLLLAAVICGVGTYASFAIGHHAARAASTHRKRWGAVAVVSSGCTAWATHFIVLLAFKPGMPAAFEPALTILSLACAIAGIGAGVFASLGSRRRSRQFGAGLMLGVGVAALHYVGQAAYLVRGSVTWDHRLVFSSILISVPLSGLAMVAAASRNRRYRRLAAPSLLGSIALLHFFGMAAMTLHFDPGRSFPPLAISPQDITPVVAGVSLSLIALAVVGWRLDLSAKARVRHDRKRLRELADVALEGLLICEGDAVITANNSMERLSGRRPGALAGEQLSVLLPGLDVSGLPEREEREAELIGAGGQAVPVRVLRCELALGHKLQTVIAVRDQRERLRSEARIRSLAFNDPLTGLPNRTRFFDLLAVHAASRPDHDRSFAVLMLDLDRFKPVNDTHGHAAGDTILRMVAERLQAVLQDGDVVARLGGDEFAILQLSAATPAAAEAVAKRAVEAIGFRPFMFSGQAIHLGASVGFAWAPEDGSVPAELLRDADLALYAAKAEGKGTFRRYSPALSERSHERRILEAGLRHAISEGHLELHYQPVVDAHSRRVICAEALVRWRHPSRGLIAPTEFIGLAEETGLILPLGEWVLRTACAEAVTWPDGISVAVNLSPAQFRDPALADVIQSALESAALPPGRLELEITEGVLLMNEARTLQTLSQLRASGIRISMDDFGTGYSSLSYLRKFPFDKIKIDRSFVQQVPSDVGSVAIIRAVVGMGISLGMSVTVEGVETEQQFDFLKVEGCDQIQGYYVSEPLERKAFASFMMGCRRLRQDIAMAGA